MFLRIQCENQQACEEVMAQLEPWVTAVVLLAVTVVVAYKMRAAVRRR